MKSSLTAVLLSVAITTSATAATPVTVHFATCTRPGIEHGCVVADSAGAAYNVTGIGIGPYKWLQGTAVVTDKPSYCMQGKVVDHFIPDKPQKLSGCVIHARKKA